MKTYSLLTGLILITIFSCSKSDNPSPSEPGIKSDTLGTGWTKVAFPNKSGLVDITFNGLKGYTGGDSLYHSTDGGITWNFTSATSAIVNLEMTSDKLYLISMDKLSQNSIGSTTWPSAVNSGGMGDAHFIDNNEGYYFSGRKLYKTINGGNAWTEITLPLPQSGFDYSTLHFYNSNTGWLATDKKIYKTDGTTTLVPAAVINGLPTIIHSLYAVSASVVFAGSDGNIYKSTDGGSTFNKIAILPTKGFTDIHFTDANTGYVCAGNAIYKTDNSGSDWTKVVSMGEASFIEIYFTDPTHGWACGSNGTIVKLN